MDQQMLELERLGFVPKLYPIPARSWIEVSQFDKYSSQKKHNVRGTAVVVLDRARWAASTSPLVEGDDLPNRVDIYSGDGQSVGKYNRRTFGVSTIGYDDSGNALGLSPDKFTVLYHKLKEEKKMAEQENVPAGGQVPTGDVSELMADLQDLNVPLEGGAAPADANLNDSNVFEGGDNADNAGDKEDKEEKPDTWNENVRETLNKIEAADSSRLQTYNFIGGKYFGGIVNNEEKVEFSLRRHIPKENGHKVLVSGVPDWVINANESNQKVDDQYYKVEFKLAARQSKPGKLLGGVIAIPVAGLVNPTLFQKGGTVLEPNESLKGVRHLLLSAEEQVSFIIRYFGKQIKEAPETHGDFAGVLKVVPAGNRKKVQGQYVHASQYNRRLKRETGSGLFVPGNYLPLKTYETIDATGVLKPEEENIVNVSLFNSMVTAGVPKNAQITKFEAMNPEDKAKFIKAEDGDIQTAFFTRDTATREELTIAPYYDSKGKLDKYLIPVKRKKEKKDGTLGNYTYVTYDCRDEAVLKNPADKAKTSLYGTNPHYNQFLDAVGRDIVNEKTLRELTKKSGGGRSKVEEFSAEEMLKMEIGITDSLFGENLEVVDFKNANARAIDERLYKIHTEVMHEVKQG